MPRKPKQIGDRPRFLVYPSKDLKFKKTTGRASWKVALIT